MCKHLAVAGVREPRMVSAAAASDAAIADEMGAHGLRAYLPTGLNIQAKVYLSVRGL